MKTRGLLTIMMTAGLLVILSPAGPTQAATVDLLNDPANCGAVGFHVPAGAVCQNGIATVPER